VHEGAVIEPKRTRNLMLDVSKFPPELLGNIFRPSSRFNVSSVLKGWFRAVVTPAHKISPNTLFQLGIKDMRVENYGVGTCGIRTRIAGSILRKLHTQVYR